MVKSLVRFVSETQHGDTKKCYHARADSRAQLWGSLRVWVGIVVVEESFWR
jgi:hypothetical protein